MAKVSVIIPSRVETLEIEPGVSILQKMVSDIYAKAAGEIEVIVVFDGPPYQELGDYPNLVTLHRKWRGTKPCINEAAKIATGKYLFKMDSHCMVAPGFDAALQEMEDNWIVTPRFYVLDAEKWVWQDDRYYDYFFLPCPFTYKRGFMFQAGGHWKGKESEQAIDENMKLHGSAFFVSRDFFCYKLGGFQSDGAGTWNGEDIELTMKTWLGPWGGKLMVNKNTWYAHMHRGEQRPREWGFSYNEAYASAMWTARYWMSNAWPGQVHGVDWLVDKFWPVPGWPDNWKELHTEWLTSLY